VYVGAKTLVIQNTERMSDTVKRRKIDHCGRYESVVSKEKIFYQWVKSQLFYSYLHYGETFVNLGSGDKDTFDILTYSPRKLLNIDKDTEAVEKGFRETKERQKSGIHWHIADLTQTKTFVHLIEQKRLCLPSSVNVFISNFSLNYLCFSEEQLGKLFEWIYTFLAVGGYFIGMFEDADLLLGSVMNNELSAVDIDVNFSHSFLESKGKEFGHTYTVSGSYTSAAVAGTAYLTFWDLILKQATRAGLRLISTEPLDEAYKRYNNPNLNRKEMQLAFLNRSFAFQKN
jgi:hypothetical protein